MWNCLSLNRRLYHECNGKRKGKRLIFTPEKIEEIDKKPSNRKANNGNPSIRKVNTSEDSIIQEDSINIGKYNFPKNNINTSTEPFNGLIIEPDDKNKQILTIFTIFKEINPTLNFGHKTHRNAINKLLKVKTFNELKKITEYSLSVQGQNYAPVITTPTQLNNKLAELRVFYERKKNSQKEKGFTL